MAQDGNSANGETGVWGNLERPRTVGVIFAGAQADHPAGVRAGAFQSFLDGMALSGLVEGIDFTLKNEFLDGPLDANGPQAVQRLKDADAILTMVPEIARYARAANIDTPIVQAIGYNQKERGAVDSYARPGRNVTGVTAPRDLASRRMKL